jgi:hypothetical protein
MRCAATALLPAAVLALAVGYIWPVASGQGHCAETVTFNGGAPQYAQRKTGTVCGKQDQGKTGSMPAAQPLGPQPDGVKPLEVSA